MTVVFAFSHEFANLLHNTTVSASEISYILPSEVSEYFEYYGSVITEAVSVVIQTTVVVANSKGGAVFVQLIQMLMVIRVMNLVVPQTFYVFLRHFSKTIIDYIPNFIKDLIRVPKKANSSSNTNTDSKNNNR
jgi:hypothetical protein